MALLESGPRKSDGRVKPNQSEAGERDSGATRMELQPGQHFCVCRSGFPCEGVCTRDRDTGDLDYCSKA